MDSSPKQKRQKTSVHMCLHHLPISQYHAVAPKPSHESDPTVNASMVSKLVANNATVCWSTVEEIIKWDIIACPLMRVIDSDQLLQGAGAERVKKNPLALAEVSDHVISTHCIRVYLDGA